MKLHCRCRFVQHVADSPGSPEGQGRIVQRICEAMQGKTMHITPQWQEGYGLTD